MTFCGRKNERCNLVRALFRHPEMAQDRLIGSRPWHAGCSYIKVPPLEAAWYPPVQVALFFLADLSINYFALAIGIDQLLLCGSLILENSKKSIGSS